MNNSERLQKAGEELVRLSSFPELNPFPVVEADTEGRVRFANPAAKRLFPGLINNGLSHEWLSDWHSIVSKLKNSPDNQITRDVAVGPKHYQQSIYYIKENDRILMYGMDITERKTEEEARNSFIALMSHELRNPLTSILSGVQLIRNYLDKKLSEPALPPFIEESFFVIENQASNMAKILSDLLDISRISRGIVKLQKRNINTGDSLKKAIEPARKLRVLAVDDNETITTLFSHALALFGHETVTCNNSFEALETAKKCDPHVAMIDIGMPGMDGYAVASELRKYEKENGKSIKLIAVTGFSQEADIKKAMEAGFDLHLTKPVELDTLEKALNELFMKNNLT